jgi:hypothetical protein
VGLCVLWNVPLKHVGPKATAGPDDAGTSYDKLMRGDTSCVAFYTDDCMSYDHSGHPR